MLHAMRNASPARKTTSGFTLVELLVVIVVIGVLAAIAVPIFLDQSDKANDAALKSDLANAAKLLTIAYAEDATLPTEFTAGQQTQVTGVDGTVYGSLSPSSTLRVDTSNGGLCVTGAANGTDFQTIGGTVSQGSCTLVSSSASEPGAPFNLSATASDGQVVLVWSAPQDDGGDAVTGYTVEYATSAEGPWTEFETTTDTTSTITGLTNSTAYYFQVSADNNVGSSVATSTTATPIILPAKIDLATMNISENGNNWTFSASQPSTNGGSAIVEYVLEEQDPSDGTWTELATYLAANVEFPSPDPEFNDYILMSGSDDIFLYPSDFGGGWNATNLRVIPVNADGGRADPGTSFFQYIYQP